MEILTIKKGREKSLMNKHPWVFSGAILQAPNCENGAIVAVKDSVGNSLGLGFWDVDSQISCRLFHFGSWKNVEINNTYWIEKLESAYNLRKKLLTKNTNVYRLLYAEGDFLPGIIVDVYSEVAVIQLLTQGALSLETVLIDFLKQKEFKYFYLKSNKIANKKKVSEERWIGPQPEEEIIVKENGVLFAINVETGQKTGFFIDQRDNRLLLSTICKDKTVLNTFSFTGGFSLYALLGGAKQVISVDISEDAILACDKQVEINKFKNHKSVIADCFDYLRTDTNKYDIIILDPPAFAKSADKIQNATRGYKELNMLGIKKLNPGGILLTFSCSQHIDKFLFQKIVFGAAADVGKNVRIIQFLSQPFDHPINIYHPEGEYLKGLLLYVE